MRGKKPTFFQMFAPRCLLFIPFMSFTSSWLILNLQTVLVLLLSPKMSCQLCVNVCVCVCFKTSSSSSSPPLSSHVSNSFTVTDPCHWHTKALAGGVIRHIHTVSVTHTFYTNTHGVMWIFLLLLLY